MDRSRIVRALLKGKVGGPTPEGGIHVYHSSPYDFDKFDWSKLRTGEGANTYGAGFYFAENPAVSGQGGQYWQQFRNKFSGPEYEASKALEGAGFDRELAAYRVRKAAEQGNADPSVLKQQFDLLRSGEPVGPRTYEVNINARPDLMLDWDKPLSAQPHIRDVLERETSHLYHADRYGYKDPTGEQFIKKIAGDDPGVSQELASIGIPGIRYLDQGSRGRLDPAPFIAEHGSRDKALEFARGRHAETVKQYGEGSIDARDWSKTIQEILNPPSYNYVVTDPSKLDIWAKYGVVPTAGGGLSALAAQDQYEARP